MISDAALLTLIEQKLNYAIAFAFGYVRFAAVLQIFPLFTSVNVRGGVRSTFALVLTIPLAPVLEQEIAAMTNPTVLTLAALGLKEFIIGILIGCLVSVPFWGIQTAGDIIDATRGASAANLADPVNANENSIAGTILLYVALSIFIVVGGLQVVIGLVYDTYGVLKVTQMLPELGIDVVASLGQLLTRMFILGILVSGPLMIVLTAIDLSLVFGTRLAKQIQVTEFSSMIKNLAVAAFIPLYAVFLEQYMLNDWRALMQFTRGFLRLDDGG